MKKFIMEQDYLELFPESKIGILICEGIDNHIKEEDKYESFLRECEKLAQKHIQNPEFTQNPIIRTWRDAFYKFKTKKGARCSIEALLKRVSKGNQIGTIIPLVDIYNGISLKYGVPIGGEDFDKFEGDMRLTIAEGGEDFVTYGSDKSEPPYPGEVVYKDNAGAICRCFNWRESVRTMLQEDTTNAFMIMEAVGDELDDVMDAALDELKAMIETELGGKVTKHIASAANPEVVICE
ncbi:MAG: B3/4 domain-containing protein [Bacillota bacterium]|nr:B3/4 domain-containing protein [Bacillota bacterium]